MATRDSAAIYKCMETQKRQAALDLFRELSEALDLLVQQIRSKANGVLIYELPTVDAEDKVSTFIPVTRHGDTGTVDSVALDMACRAFTHFHQSAGQKSTTTFRMPGIISVTADVGETILQVNLCKERLQSHLQKAYRDTVTRSRVCKLIFPGMHMNHLYRHVHSVPENIRRLNFTWQCQTPADVWITPAEAIELTTQAIEEESQRVNATAADRGRLQALKIALQHFRKLPEPRELGEQELENATPDQIPYQLVRRNHVRPHPRVQMFDPEMGRAAVFTHSANLPLIALSGSGRDSPDVRHLKDYEAGRSRKRSDTKRGFTEISQALHILGGYPSVDHYRRRLALRQQAQQRQLRRQTQEA